MVKRERRVHMREKSEMKKPFVIELASVVVVVEVVMAVEVCWSMISG